MKSKSRTKTAFDSKIVIALVLVLLACGAFLLKNQHTPVTNNSRPQSNPVTYPIIIQKQNPQISSAQSDLWVYSSDGTNGKLLVSGEDFRGTYRLSPNKDKVFVYQYRGQGVNKNDALHARIIDIATGKTSTLDMLDQDDIDNNHSFGDVDWLDNNSLIYSLTAKQVLKKLDLTSMKISTMSTQPIQNNNGLGFVLSPQKDWLVYGGVSSPYDPNYYSRETTSYAVNVQSGKEYKLPQECTYSYDNTLIPTSSEVFCLQNTQGINLFRMHYDGSQKQQITFLPPGTISSMAVNPSVSLLVLNMYSQSDNKDTIYSYDLKTNQSRPLFSETRLGLLGFLSDDNTIWYSTDEEPGYIGFNLLSNQKTVIK
jgi:hypothetical protein